MKPNLLLVMVDQLSGWALSRYGSTCVDTPHIDAIGREGATFRQFFTNSALCTPSRGCFMTGRYPHAHGAYANGLRLGDDEVTLAHLLARAGYDTGYIGKWHLAGEPRPGWMEPEQAMGFADTRFMFNRGHWKSLLEDESGQVKVSGEIGDERTYTTDWLTAKAIDYVRQPRERPFFLMLSIPDPHDPYTVREPYASMYDPAAMEVPPTFAAGDRPAAVDSGGKSDIRGVWSERRLQETKAAYCGEVKCIDDNVGKLMQALREAGLLDGTIVVFTSDHGEYMGEHGLMHKNNVYETAYRVPLLVRWPAAIRPGTEVERLVAAVDVMPTLAGLIGVAPCGREQGKDASPLLRGELTEWIDEVFLHQDSQRKFGVFTPGFELVYADRSGGVLFDRLADPKQLFNRIDRPSYREHVVRLTGALVRHGERAGCPELNWLKEQLSHDD
ncbi:sulfatase-like hydrolase/transferase [Paenibacillus cymbidii]|uniref:sulfatase-like hydrolase/transferase n=1 Tax=Paenibacillus cymbidii TaxID=1639034 RepID=UPI0010816B75|nr:sulfatase-like hydrolase/transferase [Paenibacillus cymbidii]